MARVLVADDDPDILMLVEMRVTHLGHEVITAPDGEQALSLLREQSFDLLVVDNIMPRMTGVELVSAVRSQPEATTRLPIIMISALGASGADVDVSMSKPFSLQTLAEHVTRLLVAA
jgi:CheY-like chemotaxis protein